MSAKVAHFQFIRLEIYTIVNIVTMQNANYVEMFLKMSSV